LDDHLLLAGRILTVCFDF